MINLATRIDLRPMKHIAAVLPDLTCLCLVIHAYANGGNWRYTVEHYACGVESITTQYEYTAPPPVDALTREQLQHQLDQFRREHSTDDAIPDKAI